MRSFTPHWAPWLLLALMACDSQGDTLEDARRAWRAAGISSYSFRYRTTGFTGPLDVRVTVTGGIVTGVERLGEGFDLPPELAPTIDSLFDQIQRELDSDDVDVRVRYDAALGYPVSAYFDAGEEGDGFEVSDLTAAPGITRERRSVESRSARASSSRVIRLIAIDDARPLR